MKKLKLFLMFALPSFALTQENSPEVKKWANESEGSVVVVGGNSDAQTYSIKQKTSYEVAPHKLTLNGYYLMGKANSQTNAENWSAGLRYDYAFSEMLGAFIAQTVSGDRFKNIDYQYDTDTGLKYTFWKVSEKDYALAELGYRFTSYDYTNTADDVTHYARAYTEASKGISDSVLAKAWVEYLPNLEDSEKFLVNFEPSLQFTLSQIFSVKTGLLGRYDSRPTASEKFDYTYTLALIAKY